jgi:hypothetical protein
VRVRVVVMEFTSKVEGGMDSDDLYEDGAEAAVLCRVEAKVYIPVCSVSSSVSCKE